MGILDIVPAGVISGHDVYKVYDYARENHFAIPAFNVTTSSVANAALEAAREAKAPVIIEVPRTSLVRAFPTTNNRPR